MLMHVHFVFKLLLVPFLFVEFFHAEVLTGRVVGVTDGDTITVLDSTNLLW